MLETVWDNYLRLLGGIVIAICLGAIWAVIYPLITGNRKR